MPVINSQALVAAQLYGTAQQPQRHPLPERVKPHQIARPQIEDQVTLRGTEARSVQGPPQLRSELSAPDLEAQPANATGRPRRPGSIVDIKA